MAAAREDLPKDVDALRAALVTERARAARVEAELAVAKAKASDDEALIVHQRLQIEKLTRQLYGQHSERTVRLLDLPLASSQLVMATRNSDGSFTRVADSNQLLANVNGLGATVLWRNAVWRPPVCSISTSD
jgi:hypothetical protein